MTPEAYMYVDGALLVVFALQCWILAGEDPLFEPRIPRAAIAFAGFVFFSQAVWLFGSWVPSAAGAPWWRALCDAALVAIGTVRLAQIVRERWRLKQRIAGIAAMRNPNLDVTIVNRPRG